MKSRRPASRRRRHLRQQGMALRARHHDRPEPPARDVPGDRAEVLEGELHVAGDQVGRRRGAAGIGHMRRLRLRQLLEEFHGELVGGADAARRVGRARVALQPGDEPVEVARRHPLRVHHQHVRRGDRERHRREVAHRVVAEIGPERGVDGVDADGADHQRVPIRRRAGEQPRRHLAIRAGPVLGDHRLADRLLHPRGDGAGHDVGRPAGDERDEHHHRPRRPAIGGRAPLCANGRSAAGRRGQGGGAGEEELATFHAVFLGCSLGHGMMPAASARRLIILALPVLLLPRRLADGLSLGFQRTEPPGQRFADRGPGGLLLLPRLLVLPRHAAADAPARCLVVAADVDAGTTQGRSIRGAIGRGCGVRRPPDCEAP